MNFAKTSNFFNLDRITPIEWIVKSLTNSSSVGIRSKNLEAISDFSWSKSRSNHTLVSTKYLTFVSNLMLFFVSQWLTS